MRTHVRHTLKCRVQQHRYHTPDPSYTLYPTSTLLGPDHSEHIVFLQATLAALPAEQAAQEERVAAVHLRLAAQAPTALAGIKKKFNKYTVATFMQHCVMPRVMYSPQVCACSRFTLLMPTRTV